MAGFKKDGMSVSRAFAGGGNNNSQFRAHPRDRLVEVVSYNTGQSTLIGRDVDTGKLLEAVIDASRIAEINQKAAQKAVRDTVPAYQGHLIDARMEKENPPGHRIVLERTVPRGRPVSRDGEEYMQLTAHYVRGVPDSSPEKSFRAPLTGEAYQGRFSAIQAWEEQALDVGKNEAEINAKFALMDEIQQQAASGQRPVGVGIMLRAVVPLNDQEKADNRKDAQGNDTGPQFEVIDNTEAFHWVAPSTDASGKKIDGYQMGSKEGAELINDYMNYLNDKFPEGSFGPDRDFQIEAMFFRNFKASVKSYGMAVPQRGPLASLITTPTKCAQDDENFVYGRNFAVDGILLLTKDVAPDKKGDDWTVRNMADSVFANGFRAPIAAMVRSADGGRVRLHPNLVAPRPDYGNRQDAEQSAPAQQQAPANQPAPAGDGFEGASAFEQALMGADAAAPEQSAPAQQQAPAAPATGGSWPARGRRPA